MQEFVEVVPAQLLEAYAIVAGQDTVRLLRVVVAGKVDEGLSVAVHTLQMSGVAFELVRALPGADLGLDHHYLHRAFRLLVPWSAVDLQDHVRAALEFVILQPDARLLRVDVDSPLLSVTSWRAESGIFKPREPELGLPLEEPGDGLGEKVFCSRYPCKEREQSSE